MKKSDILINANIEESNYYEDSFISNNTNHIDTTNLYRMPWTNSDNAFSWIEPTRYCDLSCEYCYQYHDPNSHKSLKEFEDDLKGLLRLRKTDSIFIAGGEPLTHPKIVEITSMVKSYGVKPVLLTNGNLLTRSLLHRLKEAGAHGFVFHVDAGQHRPGWKGKNERELNTLRQKLADMVYEEQGLICGFNTVILPRTLNELKYISEWTIQNIHKVCTNVIIPVRMLPGNDRWDYSVNNKRIDINETVYGEKMIYSYLSAKDLSDEISKTIQNFRFSSFLGGTIRAEVPKWLFCTHIGNDKEIIGNIGSKAMEMIQNAYHLIRGKYLSYLNQKMYSKAILLFLLCIFDTEIRKAIKRYISSIIRNPLNIFKRLYLQTIVVMQPQDILSTGEQDQCDGCPNKTYWNGRLVSECRMEDFLKYGSLIQLVKKDNDR